MIDQDVQDLRAIAREADEEAFDAWSAEIDDALRENDNVRLLAIYCRLLCTLVRSVRRMERAAGRPFAIVETQR